MARDWKVDMDWTGSHWQGTIKQGGWAYILYSCQITHGGLITIG